MQSVLAPVRDTFRAVAVTVVPEAAGLTSAQWTVVEATVERALGLRPPALRRQLRLLLHVIRLMPVARWGRPFPALDNARRTRVLRWLEDSRVFLLRRGFWGLRTLVLLGYYTRPGAGAEIGYGASAGGWETRR